MAKILVLGGTGMLGSTVARYFDQAGWPVAATCRTQGVLAGIQTHPFDVLSDPLSALPDGFDYVLNCIGIIKPFMADDPPAAITVNALFPWRLSAWCAARGARLIHITTDCVYSGSRGKYVESDLHDATDTYGKSKSLGECPDAMVLRTSIIGEELHKHASLVAWAKSQKGGAVNGFSTHLWNGVTTRQYAKICAQIIERGLFEPGLFHVFAADDISKLDMLRLLSEKYDLSLSIAEKQPQPVDRTLRTEKTLCAKLAIPTVRHMIMEM